jgi:NADH dehydrogenase (ubiquinone) 1 alpha subcomplex subunit 10
MNMKFGNHNADSFEYYNDIRRESITDLLRPHVVIYLDIPPEMCVENVKKRGVPHEVNSPLNCVDFYRYMEESYKEEILPELNRHAEVLVYDWKEGGDIDLIIEDLEALDFDQYEKLTQKMEDWKYYRDTDFDDIRKVLTLHRCWFYRWFSQPEYNHPSVLIDQESAEIRQMVYNHHNMNFVDGYDPDKHPWWKTLFLGDGHFRDKWERVYFAQSYRDKWTQLKYF